MRENRGFFPVRYQCHVCGKHLTVFHLCSQCLQPIHAECGCHLLPTRHEAQQMTAAHQQSPGAKAA